MISCCLQKNLSSLSFFMEFDECVKTIIVLSLHCGSVWQIKVIFILIFKMYFTVFVFRILLTQVNSQSNTFQIFSVSLSWCLWLFRLEGTFQFLLCPIFTLFFIHFSSIFTKFKFVLWLKTSLFRKNSESFNF